jgi:hypothetical protein
MFTTALNRVGRDRGDDVEVRRFWVRDQLSDVLDAPCGNAQSDFHRPGKSARFDSGPPGGAGHRNQLEHLAESE